MPMMMMMVDCECDWKTLAQNRVTWYEYVLEAMNFRVPQAIELVSYYLYNCLCYFLLKIVHLSFFLYFTIFKRSLLAEHVS